MSETQTEPRPPEASASSDISGFLKEKTDLIKRYRTVNNALTLSLVGVLLLFVALIYSAMTHNFTAERVQKALAEKGPDLVAPLTDAAIDVALQSYPVYQSTLTRAFVDAGPGFAQMGEKELTLFSEQVGKDAQEQVDKLFEKVLTSPQGSLARLVPSLKLDKDAIARIKEKNLRESEAYLSKQMVSDMEALRTTVFKLDDPKLPKDDIALSKLMVHNLIMLVDLEVLGGK